MWRRPSCSDPGVIPGVLLKPLPRLQALGSVPDSSRAAPPREPLVAAGQDLQTIPSPAPYLRSHLMNSSRWPGRRGSIAEPRPPQSVVLSLQGSHPWNGGQGCLPETGVSTPPLSSSPGQQASGTQTAWDLGGSPSASFALGWLLTFRS